MKVKKQCILLTLLFHVVSGICQDSTADKLKAALVNAKEDSSKVNLLLSLSAYYLDSETEQARKYSLQALDLATRLKFQAGRARALKNIGSAYYFQGNTIATLDYFGQALHVYDSIGDLIGKAKILNNFGTVYFMNGSNDKALEYYYNSLNVAEKIGAKADIATAYVNIGGLYSNKPATFSKALEFYIKALNISEEIGYKNVIGAVSVNIGEIYFKLDKDDSALFYFYKSLDAYANTINIPFPLRDIGIFYAKKGDFKKAIEYHTKSYQKALQFDSKLDMTQTLKALGDTYFKKGDYESALISYKKADSIAASIPAFKELDEAYAGLAAANSKLGDFDNAFYYQKKFSDLADTLNNQMLADKTTALQKNFEIQSKQNNIDLLVKDKKLQELDLNSQKLQKTIISGGLALILVIAIIIFRNYLQSAKTNKLLDLQKAQIETLLENILPVEVARELQRDGRATPRFYESVSVLFTDFKDFTRHADTLSPQEIVSELNACFIAFDDIIEKHDLEKIKTIGDSYMCAGGIPTENTQHTLNMIHAGHDIQLYMKNRNDQRISQGLQPWNLRIGVHVGPVVAGVVGRKKYAYDIWGSTVNIASRMESNGEPGMINISSATYNLIKHEYTCVHRGKIFAKNIGEIDMYFVENRIV
jgi:adenylate cyclase